MSEPEQSHFWSPGSGCSRTPLDYLCARDRRLRDATLLRVSAAFSDRANARK